MPFASPRRPRRRSRQRLRDDQDLLDALLTSVDRAIVACGVDGRLTHANRCAQELMCGACELGVAPESWIAALRPRTASGVPLPREDLPPVRALAGETVAGVDVLVTIGAREVLLCVSARPVNDERARRRGAVLSFEDVTEQRRREARLRAEACSQHDGSRG